MDGEHSVPLLCEGHHGAPLVYFGTAARQHPLAFELLDHTSGGRDDTPTTWATAPTFGLSNPRTASMSKACVSVRFSAPRCPCPVRERAWIAALINSVQAR